MFIKVLLNDLKFLIAKKKMLFAFFIAGIFIISMFSNLIINNIRYDFHSNLITYDKKVLVVPTFL